MKKLLYFCIFLFVSELSTAGTLVANTNLPAPPNLGAYKALCGLGTNEIVGWEFKFFPITYNESKSYYIPNTAFMIISPVQNPDDWGLGPYVNNMFVCYKTIPTLDSNKMCQQYVRSYNIQNGIIGQFISGSIKYVTFDHCTKYNLLKIQY